MIAAKLRERARQMKHGIDAEPYPFFRREEPGLRRTDRRLQLPAGFVQGPAETSSSS